MIEQSHHLRPREATKLLHEPIVRLRALSGPSPGDGRDGAAGALAELFGIDAAPKFDGA